MSLKFVGERPRLPRSSIAAEHNTAAGTFTTLQATSLQTNTTLKFKDNDAPANDVTGHAAN